MDFLIVYKWLVNWECDLNKDATGVYCDPDRHAPPPSIISTMMDIGLNMGGTVNILLFRIKQEQCGVSKGSHLKTQFR